MEEVTNPAKRQDSKSKFVPTGSTGISVPEDFNAEELSTKIIDRTIEVLGELKETLKFGL